MSDVLKAGDAKNQVVLSDLLPPQIDGLHDLIKQHLQKHGPTVGLDFLAGQATSALGKELDKINLIEQLANGWATFKTVRKAAHATSGETAVITLGEHHLTLAASPTLKLTIAGVRAPDLMLTLTLAAAFDSATLSLRDRELVAADPGDCEFTVGLSSGAAEIGSPWRMGKVDLKGPFDISPACPVPV